MTMGKDHDNDMALYGFLNRVRSLFNIDYDMLPELSESDWPKFRDDPPGYFIRRADLPQMRAIWREVEKHQK
jgi:hypothetical protein